MAGANQVKSELIFNEWLTDFSVDICTCKTCNKTKCRIINSKILKNRRNVNSLSSRKNPLIACPVGYSKPKILNRYYIVQRRIKSYCINHYLLPPSLLCSLIIPSYYFIVNHLLLFSFIFFECF